MSDTAHLLHAATYAARKHIGQKRKNVEQSPYINHPLEVANVLANEGEVTDMELLIAALLHDTVEDTDTSQAEITELFGESVSKLVAEVTDDKSLPKHRRKELQIETAPHKSDRAKQLKLADKISNVRDFGPDAPHDWDFERKTQYLNWAEAVIAGCRGVNPALERLFDEAVAHARERIS